MNNGPDQRAPVTEEYLQASTIGELTALDAPVLLVEYDPEWPHKFDEQAERICAALGECALRVEHVGSTSVRGDNLLNRFYYQNLSYTLSPFSSGIRLPEAGRSFFGHVPWMF
jgi:hypothetical protein